jgi:hypothetical protein
MWSAHGMLCAALLLYHILYAYTACLIYLTRQVIVTQSAWYITAYPPAFTIIPCTTPVQFNIMYAIIKIWLQKLNARLLDTRIVNIMLTDRCQSNFTLDIITWGYPCTATFLAPSEATRSHCQKKSKKSSRSDKSPDPGAIDICCAADIWGI